MASIDLRYVYSLTDFVRNSKAHVERIVETKVPEVLTVNGRAVVVIQDVESYQAMLDTQEEADKAQAEWLSEREANSPTLHKAEPTP